MPGIKELKINKATITVIDPHLVQIRIDENADIDAEDIYAINTAKFELIGEVPHCVLYIPQKYGSMTQEGREVSASKTINHLAIAKAVIVTNLAQRLVANVFIRMNKPVSPTKIFSSEVEGLKWLGKISIQYFKNKI